MGVIYHNFKSGKFAECAESTSNVDKYSTDSANDITSIGVKKHINAIGIVATGVITEAKLKQLYPKEFNSWRSRRLYAKQNNIPFFNDWNVFSVFLDYIGLCPGDGFTIDRIKHELGYVPSNVRWSNKQEQSENRDNVIWLEYEGKRLTLTAWALKTGQNKSTLFKRHKAGWDVRGIITGIKPDFIPTQFRVPKDSPWPNAYRGKWEAKYRYSETTMPRIQFLVIKIREALRAISNEQSFLIEAYYPPDSDIDYEIPIKVQQRMQNLESKRMLYLSFREHAIRWLKKRDYFVNQPIDWID